MDKIYFIVNAEFGGVAVACVIINKQHVASVTQISDGILFRMINNTKHTIIFKTVDEASMVYSHIINDRIANITRIDHVVKYSVTDSPV